MGARGHMAKSFLENCQPLFGPPKPTHPCHSLPGSWLGPNMLAPLATLPSISMKSGGAHPGHGARLLPFPHGVSLETWSRKPWGDELETALHFPKVWPLGSLSFFRGILFCST